MNRLEGIMKFQEQVHEIQIENNIHVPKGNFGFVYEKTGDRNLFEKLLTAEENIYIDALKCFLQFRQAEEALGYRLEADRLKNNGDQRDDGQIFAELKEKARERKFDIKKAINKALTEDQRRFLNAAYREWIDPNAPESKDAVFLLYSELSDNVHTGYERDTERCINIARLMHMICRLICDASSVYRKDMIPVGSYYRLSPVNCESLGLAFIEKDLTEKECAFYIHLSDGKPGVYLIKVYGENVESTRDVDALNQLWEMSRDTPENVLNRTEIFNEKKTERKYWRYVFRVPGDPVSFNKCNIQGMSSEEKRNLAEGVIKSVRSLHNATPALPHRGLNPDVFLICRTKTGVRPILISFATVKMASSDPEKTVFGNLEKKFRIIEKAGFLSGRVLDRNLPESVLKAEDICSLGRILNYIYTGTSSGISKAAEQIPFDLQGMIVKMTSMDAATRPDIYEVYETLVLHRSSQYAELAAFSVIGLRAEQEDMLLVASGTGGSCTLVCPEERRRDYFECRKLPASPVLMAVFDGLGGGQDGGPIAELCTEEMKYGAADILDPERKYLEVKNPGSKLEKAAWKMDERVAAYMDENYLYSAGCTVAAVLVEKESVYAMNVGDSKIYLIRPDRTEKISKDDHEHGVTMRKQLSQYLGYSYDGIQIVPHVTPIEYHPGETILVCSDGLTSCINPEEAANIVRSAKSLKEAAVEMKRQVRERAGRDNTTVVLYQVGV